MLGRVQVGCGEDVGGEKNNSPEAVDQGVVVANRAALARDLVLHLLLRVGGGVLLEGDLRVLSYVSLSLALSCSTVSRPRSRPTDEQLSAKGRHTMKL